jgi:hypothetical protein
MSLWITDVVLDNLVPKISFSISFLNYLLESYHFAVHLEAIS